MYTSILRIVVVVGCFFPVSWAHAAAWTQSKGRGQVIHSVSYAISKQRLGGSSELNPAGVYVQREYNPFIEYGLTDSITLQANTHLQQITEGYGTKVDRFQSSLKGRGEDRYIAGTSELGVRFKLWERKGWVASVQPAMKLPDIQYVNGQYHAIDNTEAYEIRGLVGYGFKLDQIPWFKNSHKPYSGQYHFVNLETAYRYNAKYQPDVSNEVHIDGTVGFRPKENWLMLGQMFSTVETSHNQAAIAKAQASAVWQLSQETSLQGGVFEDVWGKNAGQFKGILFSVWRGF